MDEDAQFRRIGELLAELLTERMSVGLWAGTTTPIRIRAEDHAMLGKMAALAMLDAGLTCYTQDGRVVADDVGGSDDR